MSFSPSGSFVPRQFDIRIPSIAFQQTYVGADSRFLVLAVQPIIAQVKFPATNLFFPHNLGIAYASLAQATALCVSADPGVSFVSLAGGYLNQKLNVGDVIPTTFPANAEQVMFGAGMSFNPTGKPLPATMQNDNFNNNQSGVIAANLNDPIYRYLTLEMDAGGAGVFKCEVAHIHWWGLLVTSEDVL